MATTKANIHANCWHMTKPQKTPKERAKKCGCIHMIGNKVCCECREHQTILGLVK